MLYLLWFLSLAVLFGGTWLTSRRLKISPKPRKDFPPISVLKPLKGSDPGLRENLESFFQIQYPAFELLFCVDNESEPGISLVNALRADYPKVKARLLIGGANLGPNPKVNNMAPAYASARHDVIVVSDSNVRVSASYLQEMVPYLDKETGVVTAVVAGAQPLSFGGRLEAMALHTFYARSLNLAFATGNPCVIGKSMMFRKSDLDPLGGMESLAPYLAEDYAIGQLMESRGLKVALMHQPVSQNIGNHSLRAFWSRHARWGKIRKSHAPFVFSLEPLFQPFPSACLAGSALEGQLPFLLGFGLHLTTWMACDLWLNLRLGGGSPLDPLYWLAREALAFPLWVASASSSKVSWRGQSLQLRIGGKLDNPSIPGRERPRLAWESQSFLRSEHIPRGSG